MRILLGISGSIAAYKAAELCRLLCKAGHQVRVVMTASACNFIAPLTLQALSGHPVATELLDGDQEAAMGHIALARWAELLLIAPASANTLARLAAGLADDLLSAICLATEAPLWLAPAMNSQMWQHPATQANLALLRGRGASVLGPEAGDLACGEQGAGRMLEPRAILESLLAACRTWIVESENRPQPPPVSKPQFLPDLQPNSPAIGQKYGEKCAAAVGLQPTTSKSDRLLGQPLLLQGCKVLLTAGPTQEPLDPVRFLGNRSSGKMGFALAQALVEAGAQVRLVSGPVRLATPAGVERTDVTTAAQMHQAVMQALAETGWHVFIGCAAVADYRPERQAADKIKKTQAPMMLRLVPNPDILAEVAALPPGQRPFCLGFAAETSELAAQAEAKRRRKGVELLAANLVGGPVGGFEADDNALTLFWEGGSQELPLLPKLALARRLVALLAQHLGRVQAPT